MGTDAEKVFGSASKKGTAVAQAPARAQAPASPQAPTSTLELIRAAQKKPAAPLPPKSDKQALLEIALRMVGVARSIPTPGVTDSFLHSKTLQVDADTLAKIAGKM